MTQASKFGIYLNDKEPQVVRINSPYWIPEEPDWVFLTSEVNATLLQIREMAKDKAGASDPDSIMWGSLPLLDQAGLEKEGIISSANLLSWSLNTSRGIPMTAPKFTLSTPGKFS